MLRDYFHVKDAVGAYLRLAECLGSPHVRGEAFNFSSGRALSVLQMVKQIQDVMGCGHLKPFIRNHAKGEIQNQHLSSAKAGRWLRWSPTYDLKAGLQETVAWYRHYLA